jgi:hypothetical protein
MFFEVGFSKKGFTPLSSMKVSVLPPRHQIFQNSWKKNVQRELLDTSDDKRKAFLCAQLDLFNQAFATYAVAMEKKNSLKKTQRPIVLDRCITMDPPKPKKRAREEVDDSSSSPSPSFRQRVLGLGGRKKRRQRRPGNESPESTDLASKLKFPPSILKDVVENEEDRLLISEAGRRVYLKRRDHDLIDTVVDTETRGMYIVSFYFSGEVYMSLEDMQKIKEVCGDAYVEFGVQTISLDDKERGYYKFDVMTQMILRLKKK